MAKARVLVGGTLKKRLLLAGIPLFLIIVLVAVAGSLSDLHLHIPFPGKSGITKKLIAFAPKPLDLVNRAQIHDQEGEIDEATADYIACIDSPEFEKIPARIRTAIRELADMREAATSKDYLSELLCHSDVFYWPKSRMPIKVYIPGPTVPEGFSDVDHKLICECLDAWMKVVPDKLSYKVVDDKRGADLVFSQKGESSELGLSRLQAAHTVPLPEGPLKWQVGAIAKCGIDVVRVDPPLTEESEVSKIRDRKRIFTHELGHALGLSGHSCNAGDIMFFTGNEESPYQISPRDSATLQMIYNNDGMEKLAEKYIRQRAASNDKYAILQLAAALQATQPDSPKLRKEVFELVKRAADLGLARAQIGAGALYAEGDGGPRDMRKAVEYWEKAATQDAGSAFLSLAEVYERGTGIPADVDKADYFYRRALKLDSTSAALDYADFLCYQRGTPGSYSRAIRYYKMAAEAFSCEAMARMAALYENGYGVQKSAETARFWMDKALGTIERIKPSDATGFYLRGRMWNAISRHKEALSDFNSAVRLQPKLRGLLSSRAMEYFCVGDFANAKKDLDASIAEDPDDLDGYFVSCVVHLGMNNPEECLRATREILKRAPNPDNRRLYALMYATLACRMMNQEKTATSLLVAARENTVRDHWPEPIVEYLDGKIDAAELEKQSIGEEQGTESRAFIGVVENLKGDRKSALEALKWVRQYGDSRFYEHAVAVALLNRLEKTP